MAREQLAAERDLLERISSTDALTGIPNRRHWDEACALAMAQAEPVDAYVLSCDLDALRRPMTVSATPPAMPCSMPPPTC